jgi:predicted amidophosphoribosyltransferase
MDFKRTEEKVMLCPQCGSPLEDYNNQEGGWCPKCKEWFSPDIAEDFLDENFPEDYDNEFDMGPIEEDSLG